MICVSKYLKNHWFSWLPSCMVLMVLTLSSNSGIRSSGELFSLRTQFRKEPHPPVHIQVVVFLKR